MCWGYGVAGLWPCLAEMSWLGWNHWVPQPRGSRVWRSPAWPTLCHFSNPHLLVPWKFPEIIPKWQQVLEVLHHGLNKRNSDVDICVEDFWIKLEIFHLFFWSIKFTIPSCPAALASLFFTSQNMWNTEVGAESSMEKAKFLGCCFCCVLEILA